MTSFWIWSSVWLSVIVAVGTGGHLGGEPDRDRILTPFEWGDATER